MCARLWLPRVCLLQIETAGSGGERRTGGSEDKGDTPHTASISAGRAPSGRAPPRERHHPTEKVLENGKCRVYNAAHFIGANGSLGILGESRLVASEFLGGKREPSAGRTLSAPFGVIAASSFAPFLFRFWHGVLFCFVLFFRASPRPSEPVGVGPHP